MILEPGISSAEPGPNRTGQDSGRRRAGEKATDRWCEMIPCLWDFPREGATGLGQPIAPLPVKPIWRPRAGREGGSGVRLSAQLRQQVSGASGRCWTLAGMLRSLSPPACIEQLPGLSREEGTPQTLTGRRSLLSKSGLWGWGAHRGQQASAWCWSVTLVLPLLKMFPDHPKKF